VRDDRLLLDDAAKPIPRGAVLVVSCRACCESAWTSRLDRHEQQLPQHDTAIGTYDLRVPLDRLYFDSADVVAESKRGASMCWLCETTTKIVAMMSFALCALPGISQAALVLIPDSVTVAPGSRFAVDLTLTEPAEQPFDWLRISVAYDSNRLTGAPIEAGDLLSSASYDARADGTLAEANFVMVPDPFGPGVVARLHFTANGDALGSTDLNVKLTGFDLDEHETFVPPSVSLHVAFVPEPDTPLLILVGLAALAATARRLDTTLAHEKV